MRGKLDWEQIKKQALGRDINIRHFRYESGTEFKYVSKLVNGTIEIFRCMIPGKMTGTLSWSALFSCPREAAKAVDRKLIECGREPVNILKRRNP